MPPVESMAGVPLGLLDVLGRPVVDHLVERLRRADVSDIRVIANAGQQPWRPGLCPGGYTIEWLAAPALNLWRVAKKAFSQLAFSGAELVVVIRVGSYIEVDYDALLQFHLDNRSHVTAVTDPEGHLLDSFVISGSHRNDAAYLFRHNLTAFRNPCVRYPFTGYVNRLRSVADLRRLAVDAFCGRAELQPAGVEIRPGVWAAPSARIHPRARVLAPAFIGENAKLRSEAVLTRCAVLERGAEVRPGTIVEDSTLLPHTCVGENLDVLHSVVGFGRVAHLARKVEMPVHDPTLVNTVVPAPLRTFQGIVALASYLPLQFVRGLFSRNGHSVELPRSLDAQSPSLKSSPGRPPSSAEAVPVVDAVAMRRYGNE